MQTSSAILMHDGHVLRPVAAVLNERRQPLELVPHDDLVLYDDERELLDRAALILRRPPGRRAGTELELGRDDVAVLVHALANLSRLRALRLDVLAEDARTRVGAPHDGA